MLPVIFSNKFVIVPIDKKTKPIKNEILVKSGKGVEINDLSRFIFR